MIEPSAVALVCVSNNGVGDGNHSLLSSAMRLVWSFSGSRITKVVGDSGTCDLRNPGYLCRIGLLEIPVYNRSSTVSSSTW